MPSLLAIWKRLLPLTITILAIVLLFGAFKPDSFHLKPLAYAADPPASATGNSATSVTNEIAKITSKPRYTHSTWGYSVADLKTGEVLLSQASDKMFVTGSILKTYSTSTALSEYGPDYRFRTPVYRLGTVNNGILNGNLVLVASGDFSFGLREQKDGTLAFNSAPEIDHNYADTGLPGPTILKGSDPLTALNQLAAQVRAAGIREVQGDVIIDDRLFQSFNGWPDGIIAPIWVNENVLNITVTPPTSGQTVTIDWRPKTTAYTVKAGTVKVLPKGGETQLQMKLVSPGVVQVSGQIAAGSGPLLQIWQIPDPSSFARTAFIEALNRAGVKVTAPATGANPFKRLAADATYSDNQKVAERISPPLSEYIKVILKVSYNRGADLMVCLVAVKNGSKECLAGISSEIKTIASLGVSKDSTFVFDGAGSDERDRTSPTDMTTLLRSISQKPYGQAFRNSMSILGVDGTEAQTQRGTPVAGHIRQKGGTRASGTPDDRGLLTGLTQVGYIDSKSGRQLVFALMLRDMPLASTNDIFAAGADQGAIEAALWQGF